MRCLETIILQKTPSAVLIPLADRNDSRWSGYFTTCSPFRKKANLCIKWLLRPPNGRKILSGFPQTVACEPQTYFRSSLLFPRRPEIRVRFARYRKSSRYKNAPIHWKGLLHKHEIDKPNCKVRNLQNRAKARGYTSKYWRPTANDTAPVDHKYVLLLPPN